MLVPWALRAGWALLPRLPAPVSTPLVHAVATVVADATWVLRGSGVRQLEANLRRALPGGPAALESPALESPALGPPALGPPALEPAVLESPARDAALRAASRAGMRSYLRYFADLATMPAWTRQRLLATSRVEGLAPLAQAISSGRGAVGFLGHLASWDHIGAWAASELAPVCTVAERLEPPALHEAFVAVRARLGIEALALTGAGTFGRLVRVLREGGFVPLLADRDLSGAGVGVQLLGEAAHVAAGPATLALATGAPLFPITVRYERLAGRWSAPRWGIVTTVHPAVAVPTPAGPDARSRRAAAVATMTQTCADAVSGAIRESPADWHLLQPVFDADVTR